MISDLVKRALNVPKDGLRIWWLAPVIPLLVVLPEFVQHIAEVRLGMFDSREQFALVGQSQYRMSFGILKVVGLLLAILAAVRFWGSFRRGGKWWNLSNIGWRNVLLALVLIALSTIPGTLAGSLLGETYKTISEVVALIATLPLIALLILGISGEKALSLGSIYKHGWFATARLIVFVAAVWVPLQWLHGMNHEWAFGASKFGVWSLMVFDSLIVGLLATMAGTALHHAIPKIGESLDLAHQ